jgi:hypothetical protein
MVHAPATLERKMGQYVIEPSNEDLPSLIPRCLYENQDQPAVCLVNASDRYFTIKRNTVVATAENIKDTEQHVRVECVAKANGVNESHIPEKLHNLINNLTTKLSVEEKQTLQSLLLEFSDIFSRDEFDIGTFKEVEHGIDTGKAQLIKQRMRIGYD